MKRLLLIIAASVALTFSSLAQDSRGLSFQGIARDSKGNVIKSSNLTVTFDIINSSNSAIYEETQSGILTDMAGVFSTIIGAATVPGVSITINKGTSFSAIDFSKQYSIKVTVSIGTGSPIILGTYMLQSVPYANHATKADSATNAVNATHALKADSASNGNPPGTIIAYGGSISTLPHGWLLCDGSSYTTSQYPNLYKAISSNWGSTGSGYFNVPDMRGMFLRGVNSSPVKGSSTNDPDASGRTASAPGGNTGNVGTMQPSALAYHTHRQRTTVKEWWTEPNPNDPNYSAGNNYFYSDGYNVTTAISENSHPTVAAGANWSEFLTGDVNGAQASPETRPINFAVYYIIKY